MKKLIIFCHLLFLLVMANTSYGQDTKAASIPPRRGHIGITFGPTFPLGDFGNQDGDNENAGLATTGINMNFINFAYLLHENIGVSAAWLGASHLLAAGEVNLTTWNYGGFFAGPMMTLPVSKKLSVDIEAMAGYFVAHSPEIKVEDEILLASYQGSSLGLNFGAALRYNFVQRWALLLNVDYITAKPEFEEIKELSINISAISPTLGIAYRFR